MRMPHYTLVCVVPGRSEGEQDYLSLSLVYEAAWRSEWSLAHLLCLARLDVAVMLELNPSPSQD